MSNSLWPHGLQHSMPLHPLPCPGVCSTSCPLRWWCHPTLSTCVVPFSSCFQCFPASGFVFVFSNESLLCISGQKYWSFSLSISASNIQGWFPLRLTDLISLQPKGLSSVFSNTIVQKHQFFSAQLSSQSSCHICRSWGHRNKHSLSLPSQDLYSLRLPVS